jgi:D-glycero-alpha-D-manno-heptose-7-phosphate kinase
MAPLRIIHATAPIRICDNGGWTDTRVAQHGKVFNIAVEPLVHVKIKVFARGTRHAPVVLHVENYNMRYAPVLDGAGWGPHPLLEAAIRTIPPPGDVDVEITVGSQAPPGASTGTSAAMVVALLGALDRLAGRRRTPYQTACDAHAVETRLLGGESGIQDQLCAAFGGVNFIDIIQYPRAVVSQLELSADTCQELANRLALVYLGRPHSSSTVHRKVFGDLGQIGPDDARLVALRAAAERARDALLAGDFEALGRAMRENTDVQAALHADLVSVDASRVISIARAHGAIGWKVNGAGGNGGSITLLGNGEPQRKAAMMRAIEQENRAFRQIPIALSRDGLRVWSKSP